MQLGYCTNVHPGMTLDEIEAQLDEHALGVRGHLELEVLPIGLWLPASVVQSVDVEELGRRGMDVEIRRRGHGHILERYLHSILYHQGDPRPMVFDRDVLHVL